MVGKIKIGDLNIRCTLRHRFEKEEYPLKNYGMWKKWSIGIWFKKYKAVGKKNFRNPEAWSKNLANVYTFGVEFLIVKVWIDIDYGVKHF
jgi:hypothetical protein